LRGVRKRLCRARTAFAKNLFDEQYLTGNSSGGAYATTGGGRSFGIQVTGRF